MKREFLLGLAQLPKEVVDAIMEENGRDIQSARQSALDWEGKYNSLLRQTRLSDAIGKAGGRNTKAIAALLDPAVTEGEALEQAVEQVKQECPYLFGEQAPLYAAGTGAVRTPPQPPQTLAGALRERFARKN